MNIFGKDWIAEAEKLKVAWDKAQKMHNFAPPGLKRERLQELNAAKKAYEHARGKAMLQKQAEKKKKK